MGLLGDVPFLRKQQEPVFSYHTSQHPLLPGSRACETKSIDVATSAAWFHGFVQGPPVQRFLWKDGEVQGFTAWMGFKSWINTGAPSDIGVFVLANQALPVGAGTLGLEIIGLLLAGDAQSAIVPADAVGDSFSFVG
jgi:hypothetical protein